MGSLILIGVGIGLGIQQPFIAAQTLFKGSDLAVATSVIIFVQTLAGAIILSISGNVFQNQVVTQIRHIVPMVDPRDVLRAGASGLNTAMSKKYPQYLDGILTAYNNAVQRVFLIGIVVACLGIFGVLAMEWVSVNKNKKMDGEKSKEDNELHAVASVA